MKISIVTAVLNRADFIDKCLESVDIQTHRDIEHIFVDGFSTDGTVEKIEKYIQHNKDIKCKFIQSKPKGIANAMNIGIRNATGDVIHFLHSDDYYIDETALERVNKKFEEDKKVGWLIGNLGVEYKNIRIILKHKYLLELVMKNIVGLTLIPHENTFMKKSLFSKYGYFREDMKISMDGEYWVRMLKTESPKLVNECFTVFILHGESMSGNPKHWIRVLEEHIKIRSEHKVLPGVGYIEDTKAYKKLQGMKGLTRSEAKKEN